MSGLSLVIINRDIKEYCFPSLMAFFLFVQIQLFFLVYIHYSLHLGMWHFTKLDMEPLPLNIQN